MKNYNIAIIFIISSLIGCESFHDDYFMDNRISNCSKFKHELSNISAEATLCFLGFSQPLRICSNCFAEKHALSSKYHSLIYNEVTDGAVNCKLILLQSDISSTIERINKVLEDEWFEGNCESCYKKESSQFTPDYLTFIQLAKSAMNCFQSFSNASLNFLNPRFETIWEGYVFESSACTSCQANYSAANSFYLDMQSRVKEKERDRLWNGVCGDVGDIMNTTRYLWSKQFKCDNSQPQLVYILPLFVVMVVNLLFYCLASTYFHDKLRVVFYKQRRLKHLSSDENNIVTQT